MSQCPPSLPISRVHHRPSCSPPSSRVYALSCRSQYRPLHSPIPASPHLPPPHAGNLRRLHLSSTCPVVITCCYLYLMLDSYQCHYASPLYSDGLLTLEIPSATFALRCAVLVCAWHWLCCAPSCGTCTRPRSLRGLVASKIHVRSPCLSDFSSSYAWS